MEQEWKEKMMTLKKNNPRSSIADNDAIPFSSSYDEENEDMSSIEDDEHDIGVYQESGMGSTQRRRAESVGSSSNNNSKDNEVLFPARLYAMLEDAEQSGQTDIVSWGVSGTNAFNVHKKREFERSILPKHFKMKKYKSFTRQLHYYGFTWIKKGPDKGGYCHPSFSRSNRHECSTIPLTSIVRNKQRRKKTAGGAVLQSKKADAASGSSASFEKKSSMSFDDTILNDDIHRSTFSGAPLHMSSSGIVNEGAVLQSPHNNSSFATSIAAAASTTAIDTIAAFSQPGYRHQQSLSRNVLQPSESDQQEKNNHVTSFTALANAHNFSEHRRDPVRRLGSSYPEEAKLNPLFEDQMNATMISPIGSPSRQSKSNLHQLSQLVFWDDNDEKIPASSVESSGNPRPSPSTTSEELELLAMLEPRTIEEIKKDPRIYRDKTKF